ncbi:MAG: hypothetical protein VR70_14430 [Rhodospirillaceae bacterium BRH_c57]|nr:MAG: hypothetical protein VR70_14430 [Rhodospirillaceae bacterium BRH_c57]
MSVTVDDLGRLTVLTMAVTRDLMAADAEVARALRSCARIGDPLEQLLTALRVPMSNPEGLPMHHTRRTA